MTKKIYKGKTKIVRPYSKGRLLMEFRDSVLGHNGSPDSGGDQVVDYIKGKRYYCMELSRYFFKLLSKKKLKNHYLKTIKEKNAVLVKKTKVFGYGLEYICRRMAYGSFIARYGEYIKKFKDLKYLVEITIKNDAKKDPFINDDALLELNIITLKDLKITKNLTRKVARIINRDLKKYELELVDIKVEFGKKNGQIMIIDTMNCDNMRVLDKNRHEIVGYKELYRRING